jgi:hypothetical protein
MGFAGYTIPKEKIPEARLIGCQLEASPAFNISLAQGRAATRLHSVETIAGGIEGAGLGKWQEVFRNDSARHQAVHFPEASLSLAGCSVSFVGLAQIDPFRYRPSSHAAIPFRPVSAKGN